MPDTQPTDLTETQMAYNVAQSEMFQLAAYGHHRYHPSGEALTAEGKRQQRDYNNRISAAREQLEAATLRLVAEKAETFRGGWGIVAAWLRSLADAPAELSLLACAPDEAHTQPTDLTAPVTEQPAWVDGDPLMEAVAAAVWEHCTTECGGIVRDDPRNIAAVAAAVAQQLTDQAALRDRIRRAICEAEGFTWDPDWLEPDEYGAHADAVLAVLPAPTDRATVLRDAADTADNPDPTA